MKGVYLCSRKHRIPGFDIDYNDVVDYPGINLLCSCDDVDLSKYDYIIATPPCNYYSRANWRRELSSVALFTKDLLPNTLKRCVESGKPFIVENVLNSTLLPNDFNNYRFEFGNHTFWSNVFFLVPDKSYAIRQNKQYVSRACRDNNYNVHLIINIFLEYISML